MARRVPAMVTSAVIFVGLAGCSTGTAIRPTGTDIGLPAPTTTPYPSHMAPVSIKTACQDTQLRANVISGGSEANQPFVTIAVTNYGPSCGFDGYPRIIAATGHSLQGPSQPVPISVRDSSNYEHPDPGPHPLSLPRGASASFSVGTNTASGTTYIVTSMTIDLPGSPGQMEVPVHTGASAFVNKPIDIEVTALVKGSKGPPTG
jgi:hypothetical protein